MGRGDEGGASRRVDEPGLSLPRGRVKASNLLERPDTEYSLDHGVEIAPGRSAGSAAFRVDGVVLAHAVVDQLADHIPKGRQLSQISRLPIKRREKLLLADIVAAFEKVE